jgi:hypothetical protein
MIPFDPQVHGPDVSLYELQSFYGDNGIVSTHAVPVDVPYEIAVQVPWYYMVNLPKAGAKEEGHFVTLDDDRVVFIGGPAQGAGGTQAQAPSSAASSFNTEATSGNVTDMTALQGGTVGAQLVNYENGSSGVWKPMIGQEGGHSGNSEVLAHRIDKLLGNNRVAEVVFAPGKDKEMGTAHGFIPGDVGAALSARDVRGRVKKSQIDQLLALDYIIGNVDRHAHNWIFDSDNNLWGIDHGHATWAQGEKGTIFYSSLRWMYPEGAVKQRRISIGDDLLERWGKVTREQWKSAFVGLQTEGEAGKYWALRGNTEEKSWNNLQKILEMRGLEF